MKQMFYSKKHISDEQINEIHNRLLEALGPIKRSLREDLNEHKAVKKAFGLSDFPEMLIQNSQSKNEEERKNLSENIFVNLHLFIVHTLGSPDVWTTRLQKLSFWDMDNYFKDWSEGRPAEQYRQKFKALSVKRISFKRISDAHLEMLNQLLETLLNFTFSLKPIDDNIFVGHVTHHDSMRNLVSFKNFIIYLKQRLVEKRLLDRKIFYDKFKAQIRNPITAKYFEYILSLKTKNAEEEAVDIFKELDAKYQKGELHSVEIDFSNHQSIENGLNKLVESSDKQLHQLTPVQQKSVETFSDDIQSGQFGKADPNNFNPGEN